MLELLRIFALQYLKQKLKLILKQDFKIRDAFLNILWAGAQMVNFLSATGDDFSLLYKFAKSGKFSLQENPSAFMRVLSSTNGNTSGYLNLILDGTLTLEKVDKSGKIATLTVDEIASFIQFNRNNKNISELVTSPKKMSEFLEKCETLINNAKRIDKKIFLIR